MRFTFRYNPDNSPMPRSRIGQVLAGTWMGVAGAGFSAVWLSVVGGFLVHVLRDVRAEVHRGRTWRSVEAAVTAYEPPGVERDDEDREVPIDGKVGYGYAVGGQGYTGTYRQPRTPPYADYPPALLAPHALGQAVTAWYDPADPARSDLEPMASAGKLMAVGFLVPFVLVGVAIAVGSLRGAVRMIRGRAAVSQGPLTGLLVGWGVFSIVAAIGVGLLAGRLPLRAGWRVLPAVLASALPAACLAWLAGRGIARRRRARAAATAPTPAPSPPPARRDVVPVAAVPPQAAPPAAPDGPLPPLGRRQWLPLTVAAVFWCALTGVFLGLILHSVLKHRRAQAVFVATEGVVLTSKVKENSDSDGSTYRPYIRYRYRVEGVEYTSDRWSYGNMSSSNRGWAGEIVRRHPVGSTVRVFYDPAAPGESLLALQTPGLMYFLLLLLQPFVLIGLGLMGAVVYLPLRRRRARAFLDRPFEPPCSVPGWGLLRFEMGGLSLTGSPRWPGAAAALAMGYGLSCFLAVFPVAFLGFAESASPELIRRVLLGAATVGVVAASWSLRPSGRKALLQIDRSMGLLSLTSARRQVQLPLGQIAGWTVRPIGPRRSFKVGRTLFTSGPRPSEGGALESHALLEAVAPDGARVPLHVFKGGPEGAAVAWHCARGLESLTGRPVLKAPDLPEPPPEPTPAFRSLREALRSSANLGDLM